MRGSRPRRALLYVPGTERRKIEKAAGLETDGVILDLEDAAALNAKDLARETVVRALREIDFGGRERIVRINPVSSGLAEADLSKLAEAAASIDALLVPKVESASEVHFVCDRLAQLEESAGVPLGRIRLLVLVETAAGIVRLAEISEAHERLEALLFGAEDLAGDMGAVRTPEGHESYWARSALSIHAAARRLQAIDTPYVALKDLDGLRADTRRGLELGYTGRQVVHPAQLDVVLSVYTPSAEEIRRAERIVREHERHQAEGRGVFELDGQMIDRPIVKAAEAVLERARNAGLLAPAD